MNKEPIKQMSLLDREKAVFLYSSAVERGDFETIALILEQAQEDAQLERMILEVNDVLGSECDHVLASQVTLAEDATRVKQILLECVPSGVIDATGDEAQLPPLTVRNVLAQMEEDSSLKANVRREAADLQRSLQRADVPLPEDLSQRGVRRLFSELGISTGEILQKMFRQAAIFLAMGREQHSAQLAATRRQRQGRKALKQTPSEEEK